ncbi:hypothetical protein EVAR_35262_1 [Eumeta japonica]|uniref:Uncharacterized protein n=1 Tax=Eumeta variegata TaxID=151549 RepID=A0A4C1VD13_EUMVA|nr:hypothetical protein EVAR_35262_1 [Eumeta japonica]
MQLLYLTLTTMTVAGWAASAEPGRLPLRAWCVFGPKSRIRRVQYNTRNSAPMNCLRTMQYAGSTLPDPSAFSHECLFYAITTLSYPYATWRTPAYELTYAHQVGALFTAAYANVAKDTLVTALIAQTRCRLELLGRALTHLRHPDGSKQPRGRRTTARASPASRRRAAAAARPPSPAFRAARSVATSPPGTCPPLLVHVDRAGAVAGAGAERRGEFVFTSAARRLRE